jgi:hypothetical protein
VQGDLKQFPHIGIIFNDQNRAVRDVHASDFSRLRILEQALPCG